MWAIFPHTFVVNLLLEMAENKCAKRYQENWDGPFKNKGWLLIGLNEWRAKHRAFFKRYI